MQTGAITQYIDVAQLALYAFWIFFAGLVYYLHQEDKREGYPLESDRSDRVKVQGFPPMPEPKTFHLRNGSTVSVPNGKRDARAVHAVPVGKWPGAPSATARCKTGTSTRAARIIVTKRRAAQAFTPLSRWMRADIWVMPPVGPDFMSSSLNAGVFMLPPPGL